VKGASCVSAAFEVKLVSVFWQGESSAPPEITEPESSVKQQGRDEGLEMATPTVPVHLIEVQESGLRDPIHRVK